VCMCVCAVCVYVCVSVCVVCVWCVCVCVCVARNLQAMVIRLLDRDEKFSQKNGEVFEQIP